MLIENRDVGSHNKNHESTYVDMALLHLLYIGPDGGLINLNHVTYASETEYVVCRLLT